MGFKRTYTYDPVVKRMSSSTTTRITGNSATSRTFTWSYNYGGHMTGAGRTGMANQLGQPTSIQFIRSSSSGGGSSAYVGPMVGQTIDAMGISRTVVRDINGNHYKITDRRGNQSEFAYRPDGFPVSLKDRLGKFSYWEYDTHGNTTKATDRTGRITRYEYDAGGRCTKIVDALNRALVYTYDAGDRITAIDVATVTQPNPAVSAFTVTAVLRHSTWVYNNADQVTVATDATGRQTHYAYDDVGRTLSVTDHQGHVTSYQYNGRGMMTKLTDPALRETTYAYDPDGRNTTVTQPAPTAGGAAVVTSFGYWDNNGMKSLTDANGRVTTFTPNYGTRTRRIDYPDGSYEETVKNGKNLVVSFRNRAGQVRTFTYDPERNMLSKSCPTCSTAFCYDAEDRLYRADDANTGVHGFEYDDEGRLTVSHQPDGSVVSGSATAPVPSGYGLKVSYSYDPAGVRQSMTYPDGTLVSYDYTALGQLHHIYEGAVGSGTAYTYAYDAAGRRDRLTFPSGHYSEWAYTVSGALESVATKQAGGAIVTRDRLLYDSAERLVGDEVDNGLSGGRTFGNDQLDRLVSVTTSAYGGGASGLFGGVASATYNYDATGNRTSVVSGSTATTYTLAANPAWNEYASVGGVACTYDSRHCLLTDGTRTLNYDADSRLLTATMGTNSVGYTYDWKNHLTTKEVNGTLHRRYVYDGWHVIAEYDGAGQLVTRYVQGAGVDEILAQTTISGSTSTTRYLCRDHLGSTMALVNAATGAVDQRFRYGAYGTFTVLTASGSTAPSGTTPLTNYLFTGREWQSEIALYNYRNRFYHPEQGRFCQPDPIGFRAKQLNFLAYVNSHPFYAIDSYGLGEHESLRRTCIWFNISGVCGACGLKTGTAIGGWIGGAIGGILGRGNPTTTAIGVGVGRSVGGAAGSGFGWCVGYWVGNKIADALDARDIIAPPYTPPPAPEGMPAPGPVPELNVPPFSPFSQ